MKSPCKLFGGDGQTRTLTEFPRWDQNPEPALACARGSAPEFREFLR